MRNLTKLTVLSLLGTSIYLTACTGIIANKSDSANTRSLMPMQHSNQVSMFTRQNNFMVNEPDLRKWDSPVVADLDGDSFPDLILNDHGFSIKVLWNNQGVFSKPYDLLMGDAHGVAVSDFNGDGNQEIIISRGGGSGSNARNSTIFKVDKQRIFTQLPDFDVPLQNMRGRTVKFQDLNKDGKPDLLNFAFPSKEKRGESENYIYANGGQSLVLSNTLPLSMRDGQKSLVIDANNDGYFDLLLYGHAHAKFYEGGPNFQFTETTELVFPFPIVDVTSALYFDFDNDGDLDVFLTRGSDFEKNTRIFDAKKQQLAFFTKHGPFDILLQGVGHKLVVENLQSQWPNKNIYIGESGYEYAFPDETHSGRNLTFVSSDSLGFAQYRDKAGSYLGYIGNGNWRFSGDFHSPHSGVFHGVKAYLDVTSDVEVLNNAKGITHSILSEKTYKNLLLENEGGRFIDSSKRIINNHNDNSDMAATSADIDNNGYEDLVIVERGDLLNPIHAYTLFNQGDKTFVRGQESSIVSTEIGAIGMAIQSLDYNKDGAVDIVIGNERGKWHLFGGEKRNNAHSITVQVKPSPKQKASAIGAKVSIVACGSKQLRIVGSGGSMYSQNANTNIHFGLNDCKQALVNIKWTNGEEVKFQAVAE